MPRIDDKPRQGGMVRFLQGWIGIVGFVAFGNTISCFMGHQFLADRLYTGAPSLVNPLAARLFGTWTLLASVLRVYCSLNIRNKQVYNLTLGSFLLALGHFASEICYYKSCRIDSPGAIAPIIISSISSVAMIIGYPYIDENKDLRDDDMKGKFGELMRNSKKSS